MTTDIGRRSPMSEYDYHLPAELIAQEPLADRSASRLLVVNRESGRLTHATFSDLPTYLRPGDLLVLNDSRVLPARLLGRRESGGAAEVLLLRDRGGRRWQALLRPARRLTVGESIVFASNQEDDTHSTAVVVAKERDGQGIVELSPELANSLSKYGRVPLPPYIRTQLADEERYQTVYGDRLGSAAAPTAGLHFTTELLNDLSRIGVETARVTLHVGLDTFRPVVAEFAEDHEIHREWCSIPQVAAQSIVAARERRGRIVAVGTTAVRTLETYGTQGKVPVGAAFAGFTSKFITPGYRWTMVDALVTNFHLPKSTLMLMMASFVGRELLMHAYQQAIDHRYRFYSFGDAMFVE